MKKQINFELDTDLTEDEVKVKLGYTDRVHRTIDGEVVEIENPVSFDVFLAEETKGHLLNKILAKNGMCC